LIVANQRLRCQTIKHVCQFDLGIFKGLFLLCKKLALVIQSSLGPGASLLFSCELSAQLLQL
jgi:hypothetical protein